MPPIQFLSLRQVAERLNLQPTTIQTYYKRNQLPEPDAVTGPPGYVVPGWLATTIDEWQSNRPTRPRRVEQA